MVDFDCDPRSKGRLGIMRVDVGVLPQWLMLLEIAHASFSHLKALELDTKWTNHIPGYSDSKWQKIGYSCPRKDNSSEATTNVGGTIRS